MYSVVISVFLFLFIGIACYGRNTVLYFIFNQLYFRIVLNSQERCKNSTESSHVLCTPFSLLLTPYNGTFVTTDAPMLTLLLSSKFHTFVWILLVFPNVFYSVLESHLGYSPLFMQKVLNNPKCIALYLSALTCAYKPFLILNL